MKKILCMILSIVVFVANITILANADNTSDIVIKTIITANDDYDFPLLIDYSSCVEDNGSIIFTFSFELKECLSDAVSNYSICITDEVGNEVYNENTANNETSAISNMACNVIYNYSIILNEIGKMYSGKFAHNNETANTLIFDYYVIETEIVNENVRNTSMDVESESNNVISLAQQISSNIVKGNLSSSSDTDWYKITCPSSIETARIELVLGCPDANFKFNVYSMANNGSTSLIASGDSFIGGYGESARITATGGKTYYINVSKPSGETVSASNYYYLYCNVNESKAWFSQYRAKCLNTQYWNNYLLDKLYFTNYSTTRPFSLDSSTDLMDQGCACCCLAMILNNVGAKSTYRQSDFRTNFYGYVSADPFTVALSNCIIRTAPDYDGTKYEYTKNIFNKNPVELSIRNDFANSSTHNSIQIIASDFGKTVQYIDLSGYSGDNYSNAINNCLLANPEGVMAKLESSSASLLEHWVVLVKADNSDGFVVYDPGSSNSSTGNGVKFDKSVSSVLFNFSTNDFTKLYYIA